MVWALLPLALALGLLLLTFVHAWHTRSIEDRWERALREHEKQYPQK